ncbi:hypothetical protein SAMN04488063_1810 [Halopelagius inordinatus]|uniref:Ig-like domain-containing protein n=1 Tax=Halopelagius inordinatus TaxID=553467 RepID=A0A1I2R6R4_9EURY|nr:hypothetical protein [Halopelagius inordinatus]SFG36414.1 hypothetical protein SAMN04488063_1810 [Halopelagius inordinatus]
MDRRTLLSTLAGSSLVGTAGCLDDPLGTETDTRAPTDETVETTPTDEAVGLSVTNEDDEPHSVSLRVEDGDETLLERTVDVDPGVGRLVEGRLVGEGAYRVVAELDDGPRLDYRWRVTSELGFLDIVVRDGGRLEPRQRAESTPTGGDGDGPYTVSGADDVLTPPNVEIRNWSDEDAVVAVSISHEGDRFFERSFEATTDREVLTEPVVASKAVYRVVAELRSAARRTTSGDVAETDDGRRATYEWNVAGNWPLLAVLVDEDGTLRIGCDWPHETEIAVENADEESRTVAVTLSDGEGVVAEATRTVSPGDGRVRLDVPMGDEFRLRVETEAGTDEAEYIDCYCRSSTAEISIEDGVPTVDSYVAVCE